MTEKASPYDVHDLYDAFDGDIYEALDSAHDHMKWWQEHWYFLRKLARGPYVQCVGRLVYAGEGDWNGEIWEPGNEGDGDVEQAMQNLRNSRYQSKGNWVPVGVVVGGCLITEEEWDAEEKARDGEED